MDQSLATDGATSGSRGSHPAHEASDNVVSLLEYRQKRLSHSDDDPPRPTPQAAKAAYPKRLCSAVSGRYSARGAAGRRGAAAPPYRWSFGFGAAFPQSCG